MTRVATVDVLVRMQDQVSRGLEALAERVRFIGARMRNAGIGLTIATAPLGLILKSMVSDAMEYDSVSRSIQKVSQTTGRDVAEVMAVINKHSGEMSSKLEITRGVLKLLSTDLTNTQIDQFIQLVKDGSAAMGEDFGRQMMLVTRGFKQLNPNVIDNIGINIRMKEIYRKAGVTLSQNTKTVFAAIQATNELSDAQKDAMIDQVLFTEMQRKGSVFTGIYGERINTTSGRLNLFTTRIKDLSVEMGQSMLPIVDRLVVVLTRVLDLFDKLPDSTKANIARFAALGTIIALVAAGALMLGGNLVWATGQLSLLAAPAAALASKVLLPLAAALGIAWLGFVAWGSVIVGAEGKINNLIIAILEFRRNIILRFREPIDAAAQGMINFANSIVDVMNKLNELRGSQERFNKITLTGEQAVGKSLAIDADYIQQLRNRNEVLKDTQQFLSAGMGLPELISDIRDFFGPGDTTPTTDTGAGAVGGAAAVGGGTQVYGDFIVNVEQPGFQGLGSPLDIEQLIASLNAQVQFASQNGGT